MATAIKPPAGVFEPKQPVQLEEHAEVDVLLPTRPLGHDDPTGA
jgi:hypothetical protein